MITDVIYFCEYSPSPVGKITMASDGNALIGLWMDGQKHFMEKISGNLQKHDNLPVFLSCRNWLSSYFSGMNPILGDLALEPMGSDFQKKVWQALLAIPYGKTVTYGDLAKSIECKSAQAIGGAVGKNPISILIPCHRVVGKDGSLTGYAGGLDNKQILLNIEKSHSA